MMLISNKNPEKRISIRAGNHDNWKAIAATLNRCGGIITYIANLGNRNVNQLYLSKCFLALEMPAELVVNFSGKGNVLLGASQYKNGLDDSLRIWLNVAHEINSRSGSAITALLVKNGHIKSIDKNLFF